MADATSVILLFILIAGLITVLVALTSGRGESYVKLGKAEWRIVFDNRWHHPARRSTNAYSRRSHARYYLEVKGTSWRFPLEQPQVAIGRHKSSHIRLRDRFVDYRQAVIYWDGQRYRIRNLSRRFPTLVDSRPIREQNLGNGNKIKLGRTELLFRERAS